MVNYNFVPERIRFHFYKPDTIVVIGWYRDDNPEGRTLVATYGGEKLPIVYDNQMGIPVRQKYLSHGANVNEEIHGEIKLPDDWKSCKETFTLSCVTKEGISTEVISYKTKWLINKQNSVEYSIESDEYVDDKIILSGWVAGIESVDIDLKDREGKTVSYDITRNVRKDVIAVYGELDEEYEAGFRISANVGKNERLYLTFKCGSCDSVYCTAIRNPISKNIYLITKGIKSLKKNGFVTTLKKIQKKLAGNKRPSYMEWYKNHAPTKRELEGQGIKSMEWVQNGPLFSIVIPIYKTPRKYFREMLDSILSQTYPKLEVCLADGSGEDYKELGNMIQEYIKKDSRVHYKKLKENLGISENTNEAIKMAEGDYIVLADHDDVLAPNALYECALAIREKHPDVIYSDEDKIDMNSKLYFEPNFKPDYNPDLLCSMNYICHLFVVKKDIVNEVGMLDSKYDGAQDYDFILRCTEAAKAIYHIPKVLYHWRCHPSSTAVNPESKMYAFEAGRGAVQAHYDRLGIPAKVTHGQFYGMYKTTYQWRDEPLVSIIIPNKDHIADLKVCMDSIDVKSTYHNYEYIIIENNSTEEETFAYYKQISQREDVRVLFYEGEFNYSKINNFGAKEAKGEYLLLLNNDTEIINPECLLEMLGYCMREDVGIVGARLYYKDDTIQHAGVVLGFGGIAGHAFVSASRYDTGYMNRIICAQDYSAVTAACMMVKKTVFEKVGGLTEELRVAFNDIDFCMKVRAAGYLVVYNPAVELYHYESKSRGQEDSQEKVERFNSEVTLFAKAWAKELKSGDPYYNKNLSLDKSDYSLREY